MLLGSKNMNFKSFFNFESRGSTIDTTENLSIVMSMVRETSV